MNGQGYFYYCNPETKVETGLARNKAQAVTQAIQANLHFQGQAVTLLDKILGKDARTVNDWCDVYGHHHRMKYIREGIGHYVIDKITPLQISDWLDKWSWFASIILAGRRQLSWPVKRDGFNSFVLRLQQCCAA